MNEIIIHTGAKGQRWGTRRYRNYDGTLTEEGRRRYDYYDNKTDRSYETGRAKQAGPKTYVQGRYKGELQEDLSKYTDAELKALTARAKLEKDYREAFNTKQYSKGRQFINSLKAGLKDAGEIAQAGKALLEGLNGIKKVLDEKNKAIEEKTKKAKERAKDIVKDSNDKAVKDWLLSIEDGKTRDRATEFVQKFSNPEKGKNNYGNITTEQLEQIKELYKKKEKEKDK